MDVDLQTPITTNFFSAHTLVCRSCGTVLIVVPSRFTRTSCNVLFHIPPEGDTKCIYKQTSVGSSLNTHVVFTLLKFYSNLETIIPPNSHQWVAITSMRNITVNLWFRRRKMKIHQKEYPKSCRRSVLRVQTNWVIRQEFQFQHRPLILGPSVNADRSRSCMMIRNLQKDWFNTGLCIRQIHFWDWSNEHWGATEWKISSEQSHIEAESHLAASSEWDGLFTNESFRR